MTNIQHAIYPLDSKDLFDKQKEGRQCPKSE